MKNRLIIMLLATILLTATAISQTPPSASSTDTQHAAHGASSDLALTFATERAKIQSSVCSCFWMNGGSIDWGVTFFHGFGVASTFSVEHASSITSGVALNKFSFMVGPRYTFTTSRKSAKHHVRIFAEALLGAVHGFNSLFPSGNSTSFSASALSMQFGIGSDIELHRGFALRMLEADYVRTTLPNDGSNSQNDLRLGAGLSYRFSAR